jgi:hypothetical protein
MFLDSQVKYKISSSDLLSRCGTELIKNLDDYRSFYVGKNILSEFDEYANKNISYLQVVDINFQVIANTINKNVVVADVRQNDRIIETVFPPRIGSSSEQVYILL